MRKLKRIAAPKWWPIERKVKKYSITPRGPYARDESLPLLILIRDVLKLVDNGREARKIIKKGDVFIDGKKKKDPHYGIGLFDVVEIPALKKAWRAMPKRGLSFVEISKDEAKIKLCKIINKKTLKKNKNQINLHDGKNLMSEEKYSTNDSLLLQLPDLNIKDHVKFEEGSIAVVTGGKNEGIVTKINKIENNRVWVGEEKTFEVPRDLLMVVGKNKPLISM